MNHSGSLTTKQVYLTQLGLVYFVNSFTPKVNNKFLVTLKRELSDENIVRLRNNLENDTWGEVLKVNNTTIDGYNLFRDIFQYHVNTACLQIKSQTLF